MTTSIGITEDNRGKSSALLNKLLANEHVLYIKTRNFHWNVRGMYFQSLHSFFEEQYNSLEQIIDEVAERVRALGYFANGSMNSFINESTLREESHLGGDAQEMLNSLLNDHETIVKELRNDITAYEAKYNDVGTADFATSLMETHEKMAWMIRSYLNQ